MPTREDCKDCYFYPGCKTSPTKCKYLNPKKEEDEEDECE